MAVKLTEGALLKINNGEWQTTDLKPVLQVAEIRAVQKASGEGPDRYRLTLSDGLLMLQGMLATQRNDLVRSQQLQRGSIVQLKEFNCSKIRDRILIIVIDLEVIIVNCDIIGEPRQLMQPINQPETTMASPQIFMGGSNTGSVPQSNLTGSVPQPNLTVNSPIYRPQLGPNAGSHSYGNFSSNSTHASSMHSRADSVTAMSRPPANSYMRSVQPTFNQSPSNYINRGPVAKNEAPPKVIPIAALNPYQGRWTIKGRVTAKAELRRYINSKGDGKVFSFDLLDSDGGEIRTTCFNAVADQFYDQIEVGKVYFISKGSVKPAQKAFNHLKNDHEITLDSTSTIQLCLDDDNSIPPQQYHFRPIAEIEGLDNNSVLDIIGVVSSIRPISSVQRKNGTETQKRTLTLRDMSGRGVELTLWGNFCSAEGQTLQNMCDSAVFPVLAVKSARVGEFNGKSVGTISMSQLFIEPDFPEAYKLREWFYSVGRNTPVVSLSQETNTRTDVRKTISQIKDEKLGTSEKPDWITVSAVIGVMRLETFCYTACPLQRNGKQCNKKVTNNGDGKWQCDACDQTVDQCDYRYVLQFQIQDHTGMTWVTAFQETGEQIMGIPAKDLYFIRHEEQDEETFTEIVKHIPYTKYNFKLKVKEEMFGDDPRLRSTVVKAEKIKFATETSFLLDLLKKDDPTSAVSKIETPKEPAPYRYMGSATNVVQQAALPANQIGHYVNQYGGSRIGSSCNSCGDVGHNSTNCPSVVNGLGGRFGSTMASGGGNSSTYGDCYKCHQPGHWARDCPGASGVTSTYGSGNVAAGRYGSASGQYVGGY